MIADQVCTVFCCPAAPKKSGSRIRDPGPGSWQAGGKVVVGGKFHSQQSAALWHPCCRRRCRCCCRRRRSHRRGSSGRGAAAARGGLHSCPRRSTGAWTAVGWAALRPGRAVLLLRRRRRRRPRFPHPSLLLSRSRSDQYLNVSRFSLDLEAVSFKH